MSDRPIDADFEVANETDATASEKRPPKDGTQRANTKRESTQRRGPAAAHTIGWMARNAIRITLQLVSSHPSLVDTTAEYVARDEGLDWDALSADEKYTWKRRVAAAFRGLSEQA